MNIYAVNIRKKDSSIERFYGLAESVDDAISFCSNVAYDIGYSDFVIEDVNMIGKLNFVGPDFIGEFENKNRTYDIGYSDSVIEDVNMIGKLDFAGSEHIGEFENENRTMLSSRGPEQSCHKKKGPAMNIYGVTIRDKELFTKRFYGLADSITDAMALCCKQAYEHGHGDFRIEDVSLIGTVDFSPPIIYRRVRK